MTAEVGFRCTYNLEYRSDHGKMLNSILLDHDKADWTISIAEMAEIFYCAYHGH